MERTSRDRRPLRPLSCAATPGPRASSAWSVRSPLRQVGKKANSLTSFVRKRSSISDWLVRLEFSPPSVTRQMASPTIVGLSSARVPTRTSFKAVFRGTFAPSNGELWSRTISFLSASRLWLKFSVSSIPLLKVISASDVSGGARETTYCANASPQRNLPLPVMLPLTSTTMTTRFGPVS